MNARHTPLSRRRVATGALTSSATSSAGQVCDMDEEQTSQSSPVSDSDRGATVRESTVARARRFVDRIPYGRRALVIGVVAVALVLLLLALQYFNSGQPQRGGR